MVAERIQITSLRRPPEDWTPKPHVLPPSGHANRRTPRDPYNSLYTGHDDVEGPRPDAEAADDLPVLRLSIDVIPTACLHCESHFLDQEPPLGTHVRGLLTCVTCSRQIAWLLPFLRSPIRWRARFMPIDQAAEQPKRVATVPPLPPRLIASRDEWRRPGCGKRCMRIATSLIGGRGGDGDDIVECHDPDDHEAYVRALMLPRVIRTGALVLDLDAGRAWASGLEVNPPGQEWRLLSYLAERLDCFCPTAALREVLAGAAWAYTSEGVVAVPMARLRKRLGSTGGLIETQAHRGTMLRYEPPVDLDDMP